MSLVNRCFGNVWDYSSSCDDSTIIAACQLGTGLDNFGSLQGGIGGSGPHNGPGHSGGHSGAGSSKGSLGSRTKNLKDEDDFDPVVLNNVAGWLRMLRLHKYTRPILSV